MTGERATKVLEMAVRVADARRHKVGFAVTAAILLLLAGGAILINWLSEQRKT